MRQSREHSTPAQRNQSSGKLLELLELLSEQAEPMRLQDIAQLSGMNASTALRFLAALQQRDYVAQDVDTGRYYLTFKLCGLSQKITSHLSVRTIALPFLRGVAHVFDESCNLAVESDMSVLYVEAASAPGKTLTGTQRTGSMAPLHCTGVGKLFLTCYSPAELEKLLVVKKLQGFTPGTITSVIALLDEISHVRKLDYAFDNEECEMGVRCIAVPVRDYTGRIVAGISVSGPSARMTDEHIFRHLPFLTETARQISARLGWQEKSA